MTNDENAILTAELASARQPSLSRRTTALAAHAEALLVAPGTLWRGIPGGRARRQQVLAALECLRTCEEPYYAALSARVGLIIRTQRLDRACWDFLANARELMKPALGREWSEEWGELGFPDGSLRIPSDSESRTRAVGLVADYLASHPDREDVACSVTRPCARELLKEFEAASEETIRVNAAVAAAIEKLNAATAALKRVLDSLHGEIQSSMRLRDPRWLLLFGAYAEEPSPNQAVAEPLPTSCVSLERRLGAGCRNPQPKQACSPGLAPSAQLEFGFLSLSTALAWLLPPP